MALHMHVPGKEHLMDHAFRWEAPPPERSGQHAKVYALAKRVASRPNKWACIAVYKSASSAAGRASNIRTGKTAAWSEVGNFKVVCRKDEKGMHGVWVKYLGANKETDNDTEE